MDGSDAGDSGVCDTGVDGSDAGYSGAGDSGADGSDAGNSDAGNSNAGNSDADDSNAGYNGADGSDAGNSGVGDSNAGGSGVGGVLPAASVCPAARHGLTYAGGASLRSTPERSTAFATAAATPMPGSGESSSCIPTAYDTRGGACPIPSAAIPSTAIPSTAIPSADFPPGRGPPGRSLPTIHGSQTTASPPSSP